MKTNKTLGLMVLTMLVLSVGMVSAIPAQGTLVGGIVYTDVNADGDYDLGTDTPIDSANVDVACLHNNVTYHQYDISQSSGDYGVDFMISQCNIGDSLSVTATKGSLYGSEPGQVNDSVLKWNVGIVDVPMVPEFGIVVGSLTILSAVGIFFFVRRK